MKARLVGLLALAIGCAWGAEKLRELKPGFNLFSKEQDIQLGKEAATQIGTQYTVVDNAALTSYVESVARKLWSQPEGGDYPYTIRVVNDPSINAFALPGGPMFVHTGLLKTVENEAQLAGVLAHEIAHVALRHGTNQASKANLLQLPALIGGAMAGGGLLGQLAQVGIGLGEGSVLLKYSRNAERDADLMGARLMSKAGYNPLELARFFEKLEAGAGQRTPQFLSDHPNPGNRVKAVEAEILLLPRREYTDGMGRIEWAKQMVAQLPPPPPRRPASSDGLKTHEASYLGLRYPESWEVFAGGNSPAATIAPRDAVQQDAVGLGVLLNVDAPQNGDPDLARDNEALLQRIRGASRELRSNGSRRAALRGETVLVTELTQPSRLYSGQTEFITVIAAQRPQGLVSIILVRPQSRDREMQPVFNAILNSIQWR